MATPTRPTLPRSPLSRARSIRERIVTTATERLTIKFAALLLALALWLLVSAEELTEGWVDVQVTLVMDSTVSLEGEVPRVEALVYGRGKDLLKLVTSPPEVRRVVSASTPNSVRVELRPGDVIIPSDADVRVRDVTPRTLDLSFQVTEQRYVPVRASILAEAASGMRIIDGPSLQPSSVLVRGPRSAVRRIGSVSTDQVSITVRDSITEQLVPLDTAGLGVTTVIPAAVRVRVLAEHTTGAMASPSGTPAATPSGTTPYLSRPER